MIYSVIGGRPVPGFSGLAAQRSASTCFQAGNGPVIHPICCFSLPL